MTIDMSRNPSRDDAMGTARRRPKSTSGRAARAPKTTHGGEGVTAGPVKASSASKVLGAASAAHAKKANGRIHITSYTPPDEYKPCRIPQSLMVRIAKLTISPDARRR